MKIKIQALSENLKKLQPIYIISGDENFQKEEACQTIHKFTHKAGFTEKLIYHINNSMDWKNLQETLRTRSLFASKRVIELRVKWSDKFLKEAGSTISFYTEHLSPETILILISERISKKIEANNWFRKLEQAGIWIPVWPINGRNFIFWLADRIHKKNLKISKEAMKILAEKTEGNLTAAAQEIEKLIFFSPNKTITLEQMQTIIADNAHYNIFNLAEAIINGDSRRAINIYRKLYAEGVEIAVLQGLIIKELRILNHLDYLLKKTSADQAIESLINTLKLPAFSIQNRKHEYLACLRKIPSSTILKRMINASSIDLLCKTANSQEAEEALLNFMLSMIPQKSYQHFHINNYP